MKRSTFGEVDRVRRPQGLDLHDIFIEPRQFGHGGPRRLKIAPAWLLAAGGPVVRGIAGPCASA